MLNFKKQEWELAPWANTTEITKHPLHACRLITKLHSLYTWPFEYNQESWRTSKLFSELLKFLNFSWREDCAMLEPSALQKSMQILEFLDILQYILQFSNTSLVKHSSY